MKSDQIKPASRFFQGEKSILITGATGLIGSHIAGYLLKKGHRIVVLIRSKGNLNAVQRFQSLCDFLEISRGLLSNLTIVEGALDKYSFGLSTSTYEKLCDQIDCIIHCAGNTTFSAKQRAESERDNITGLNNVLEFGRHSRCSWFHLMSTVYTAGKKTGMCDEKLDEPGLFTNVYEETKYRGEQKTLDFCRKNGIGFTILRPSIVVGDSHDGRTFRFNGLYYPLKALFLIRNMFRQDLISGDGKRAKRMSISYKNGKIHIPLRLEFNPVEGINLVPIDFVVKAVCSIIQTPQNGGIFHIASKTNVTIAELIEFTHNFFDITGLSTVSTGFFSTYNKTPLECLFDGYIEPYLPYMKDKRSFSTKNTDKVLSLIGITCPVFDYDLFSRCMNYALDNKWGKELQVC
ncbi:MAG: SDR family oxidoreductase [Candidatus Latescibacteria bacterium]|nr:SDR family oxidoreductase [Candidatus Latescibacterota bacterium]